MVFSIASIPITVGSRLMFSNTSSNEEQQISCICSPSKYWCAAMSWNDPMTPCIAIRFMSIYLVFVFSFLFGDVSGVFVFMRCLF